MVSAIGDVDRVRAIFNRFKGPAQRAALFALCDAIAPTLSAIPDQRAQVLGLSLDLVCKLVRERSRK